MMRGYRMLRKTGSLNKILTIKQELASSPLNISKEELSPLFFATRTSEAELIVRQFLLLHLGGLNLNRALLSTMCNKKKSLIYPLPSEWRLIIKKNGIKVNGFLSSFYWAICTIFFYLLGAYNLFKILLSIKITNRASKPFVYFYNINYKNLPKSRNLSKNYDVISWFIKRYYYKSSIRLIRHSAQNSKNTKINNIEILYQSIFFLQHLNITSFFKFVGFIFFALFRSALDLLLAKWWHALLMKEAGYSFFVRCASKDCLAKEYLFNNSNWIYRPLWTYDAEDRGSKIIFYFYSTNCENINTDKEYKVAPYGWATMTWTNFLVWDKWQKFFVIRALGLKNKINITEVGPIDFSDKKFKFPKTRKTIIAVFDIQPVRDSFYFQLGLNFEYYRPETAIKFIKDLEAFALKFDVLLAFKRKRFIGNLAHPKYRNFLKNNINPQAVTFVDADISAKELIEKSSAVISLPYSSTALIARDMKKISVYYDPINVISKSNIASHGISVLSSKYELNMLFLKISNLSIQ